MPAVAGVAGQHHSALARGLTCRRGDYPRQGLGNIHRAGVAAKLIRGSGDKRIPFASITAVDIKEPGATHGYLTFSVLGGSSPPKGIQLAQKDENSVVFSRNHMAEFTAAKQLVEQRILEAAVRPAAAPQVEVADQLAKLAALRDQGIMSA